MESGSTRKNPHFEVYEAMDAAEPVQATEALSRVSELLQSRGEDGLDLAGLWDRFLHLLERRGYYVRTPSQLADSLREIEAIGEGFDLYNLARSLAQYDALRRTIPSTSGPRGLPELAAFVPPVPASRRRKEK